MSASNKLIQAAAGVSGGGVPYTLQPFEDGSCVRFYTMDGSTEDLIGNDTTATITGGSYVTGKVGQAYDCEVNNQFTPGTSIPAGANTTASFWVKVNSGSTNTTHVCIADGNNGNVVYLTNFSNGSYELGVGTFTAGSVPEGVWTHCIVTRTSTNGRKIYINGQLVGTGNGGSDDDAFTRITSSRNTNINLEGLIDHVRFFNKSISDAEALTLYNIDNG